MLEFRAFKAIKAHRVRKAFKVLKGRKARRATKAIKAHRATKETKAIKVGFLIHKASMLRPKIIRVLLVMQGKFLL
jgi:hypothetical protein